MFNCFAGATCGQLGAAASHSHFSFELVDNTDEQDVTIVHNVADITIPQMVLELGEEIVVRVQLIPQTS